MSHLSAFDAAFARCPLVAILRGVQPHEVEAINAEGFRVAMPIKGGSEVLLDSRKTPGTLRAAAPGDVDPKDFDLIALAMQEPQYRSPGVRELLDAVAKSGKPCMSIMNMPPLPYLRRIPGLDCSKLEDRKSTRLNSSHSQQSRMPSSA